ncbi:MAG: hypothetical protein M1826_007405 [Phylliscum demangeonii]|nr:MAG: hypothetical protein M1826_007405 [Phylliscum demangeonii]
MFARSSQTDQRMFTRSLLSRDRAGKVSKSKRSLREPAKSRPQKLKSPPLGGPLLSAIVSISVGKEQRLFAAHEDVLSWSPAFAEACREQRLEVHSKRIELPDEEPEVFSCVLEFLYKGDYYPRLVHSKRHDSWELEGARSSPNLSHGGRGAAESVLYLSGVGDVVLKDTAVYCAAERYGLEELKRLALRKQGLQSGIEAATILRSARYAYDHTPDTESRLRAHYLALIIRCRKTFKRSGTMQKEMEIGGKLFFDLFVSLCNHVDDVAEIANKQSPRFI